MKALYRLTIVLIVLGFVGTDIFLVLGPDIVPTHYDFVGEVDRMGSKYGYILFPFISAGIGAIFLLLAKQARTKKWESHALTEKIFLVTAIGEVLLFHGKGGSAMWEAMSYAQRAAIPVRPAIDWIRFLSFQIGVLMMILGSVMPGVRKNAVWGVRTRWSMSSNEVWQKSQRFGGFASVTAGALLVVAAVFLEGAKNLLFQIVVLALWLAVCIAASYRYHKAWESV